MSSSPESNVVSGSVVYDQMTTVSQSLVGPCGRSPFMGLLRGMPCILLAARFRTCNCCFFLHNCTIAFVQVLIYPLSFQKFYRKMMWSVAIWFNDTRKVQVIFPVPVRESERIITANPKNVTQFSYIHLPQVEDDVHLNVANVAVLFLYDSIFFGCAFIFD